MPRLLMMTLLACLTLSPATHSADAEGPGVVFHLDSETSMNRKVADVARTLLLTRISKRGSS